MPVKKFVDAWLADMQKHFYAMQSCLPVKYSANQTVPG